MHNKIVKASSDSSILTGFNPSGTFKNPLDNINKMKLEVPGPSKESTKAVQKSAKSAANVASTGNKMGMSGGLQAGLGAASSMLGGLSTSGLTQEQASTREGIRSAISSVGPIGAIIGAASGVVDAIGSATGLNLDNIVQTLQKEQVLVVKLPLKVLLIVFLVYPCLWVCLEVELRSLINLQKLIKWQMPMEDQLQILMPLKH